MENQVVLSVENLSKKIGSKQIIQQASFSVEKGHVTGLLGPNGAGKTTIIRMLVGLMSHDEGAIRILGNSVTSEFKEAMTHIGAIIENPEFYNYMTGFDNLKQYARMAQKTISDERIQEIL